MRVLITGATSGIGKQLALDYNREKHNVWALGRNEMVLKELEDAGINTGKVDLLHRDASLEYFRSLEAIDLAILNAGTCEYVDLPNFDSRLFSRVMRANVESMAISIEGVLPLLRRGENPHLAGVGSSASYLPMPRAEAYGSSKAAIDYLMRTLAITLGREGIYVSLICPGFVKTPLTDKNDFPMPFLIGVEQASTYIRKGIAKRQREIHFPKRFTSLMKLFSFFPQPVWNLLARRMVR